MLLSIALIILVGFSLSSIFIKMKLPGLLGLIFTGIILGPYMLNLLSKDLLNISSDLRKIALIVILTRAGLSIDINDLKKVGRPAILMSFIPATFEIVAIVILAPLLLNITYLEAAILGTVLAAVSPAVIVPRMIKLMEEGYGKQKSIPQLIMAGASVDDIYVIVLFTSFIGLYQGSGFNIVTIISIPISILTGLIIGILTGFLLIKLFKIISVRDTIKVLLILSVSFLLVAMEEGLKKYLPFSGLLSIMALGASLLKSKEILAKRLLAKFSKIWVGAEIFLFVLVGAAVNINYLRNVQYESFLVIVFALVIRVIGVNISLLGTSLSFHERLFCSIAYLPKATVQAAIGAIPLTLGINAGNIILTLAVLSIILTAPIGAIFIDNSYKKLLTKQPLNK